MIGQQGLVAPSGSSDFALTAASQLFTGALSQHIPIQVPPGRGRAVPELAISYDSGRPNGWIGVGWDINLGAIERSTKRGVDYQVDEFVLRLGRVVDLVATAPGTYSAKIDGLDSRVRKLTDASGRPYWDVTDRLGTRYAFGSTPASRQDNPSDPGQIFKWCLDRVEDANGNYFTVTYFKDQGAIYPDTLSYTGNAGLAPQTTVRFLRDPTPRSDAPTGYASSFAVKVAYLLKTIEIRANGALVSAYRIDYATSPATQRSVLSSITRHGSDATITQGVVSGGTALPPQAFTYATGTPPGNTAVAGPIVAANQSYPNTINPDLSRLLYGDFNGDGRTDVAYVDGLSSTKPIKIFIANDSGFEPATNGPVRSIGYTTSGIINDIARVKLGDFDGNGRIDILTIDGTTGSGSVAVYLANADGSFPAQKSFGGPTVQVGTPDVDVSRIMLADFNGDGRTDVLHVPGTTTAVPIKVYLSTGQGFGQAILGPYFAVGGLSSLARLKLGDFNGDTRTDLAFVNGSGGSAAMTVYGLNAAGTAISLLMNGPVRSVRADAEGARIDASRVMPADVNGDGKTDLVALEGSGTTTPMSIYLATGSGFTARFDGPARYFSNYYPDQSLARVRLGDYNGDGRTDLAFIEGESGSAPISIYLSGGDRYYGAVAGPTRYVSGGTALQQELLRVGAGDFDGDGRTDFIGNDSSGSAVAMSVYLAAGEYPDLLASQTNGIGGRSTYHFSPAAVFENTQLPFARQVVTGITTEDGNGVVGTATYSYEGGYYHIGDRELRGFNVAIATAPIGPDGEQAETRYWYHQGNCPDVDCNDPEATGGYAQGKPYRVQVWDLQQSTYEETETAYWSILSSPAGKTHGFVPPSLVTTRSCVGGTTPACARTVLTRYAFWDPVAGASNEEAGWYPAYDATGNALQVIEYGDVDDPSDDRTIARDYSPNTTEWVVGLESGEWVFAGSNYDATTQTPIAQTLTWYDGTLDAATCSSSGSSATPVRGDATRVQRWLNGSANHPETWTGYDGYGNVTCTSDPDRRITRFEYDSTYTFRTSEEDAKGQLTQAAYYGVDGVPEDTGRYGQLKSVKDPNLIETRYEFDPLGRRTREIRPPVSAPQAGDPYAGFTVTTSYVVSSGVGTNRIESLTSEGVWKADYFDGLGRVFLAKRKGSSTPSARTFVARTVFNPTGTEARKSQPYFDGGAPRWVELAYDSRGRVISKAEPDGAQSLECFRYDGASVVIDANGHRKRTVRNVRDAVVRVEEYLDTVSSCATAHQGTPYATTRYDYDPMGRLSTITDASDTPYVVGYDTVGRVRFESDPDLGTWYYDYSAAGDLTFIQDANGFAANPPYAFTLQYDELHRVTRKDYPSATDVIYGYDDPAVPYSLGKLTSVVDASGSTTYEFDAVGRPFRRTQLIDGTPYTTVTKYDPADRIVGEVYPDPARTLASYEFDPDGFLGKVKVGGTDYAVLTGYNAFGQIGTITSPASTTAYTYYDTGNNRLTAIRVSARGAAVVDLAYAYDPARLIERITDAIDPALTFDYGYDALNRLTSSLSARFGAHSYSYDAIGNILTKEGVSYTAYDPIRVHAVKATSDGRAYSYDANGNMISDGVRVIQYDFENRPSSITYGGTTTLLTYFADGQRVKRQVRTGSTVISNTVYAGRLYECTNGACTRHVFAGDKRIASIEANGTARYYHGDHLDTTRAVTDASGYVLERIGYEPFGDGDSPGAGATRYRYTSKERDAENGLYFYGARYYDPTLGRFISPDPVAPPIHDPQSLNRYAYTRNNPISNRDPTGNAIETPWDAVNVGMGAASFAANLGAGNWGGAAWDAVGLAYDIFATAAPGIPGGAATVIRATRAADKGLDLLRAADKAADAAKVADKAAYAAKAAEAAKTADRTVGAGKGGTEAVQRVMSRAELEATQQTGLVRGGRDGTHYATDAANSDALRARERLALPQTPEVRVTLKVPEGAFSSPSRVQPGFGMPGGGMERTATGKVPAKVVRVDELK